MSVFVVAISDSHAISISELPFRVRDALRQADIIVHAGDHTELSLFDELRALNTTVIAVSGNMDSTALKAQLPRRQLVSLNGKTLGVAHGSGAPGGIAERIRALFPENPDLIVFGHSHQPFSAIVDGVLMVNPGPARKGYATITIDQAIQANLIAV